MQGKKVLVDEKVLLFSLSAHVPEHNLYHRLKQQLNLDFLYELTQPYYGRCGQQSIDTVVFFKLCLVGYLENSTSDRALARQKSPSGKRLKRLRKSTVEPVFGSLIHHYGLRKVSVRGKSGAHKVMVLAATAFNLKKYLKFKSVEVVSHALALQKELKDTFAGNCIAFTTLFFN